METHQFLVPTDSRGCEQPYPVQWQPWGERCLGVTTDGSVILTSNYARKWLVGQCYLFQQWKGRKGRKLVLVISAEPQVPALYSTPGFNPSNPQLLWSAQRRQVQSLEQTRQIFPSCLRRQQETEWTNGVLGTWSWLWCSDWMQKNCKRRLSPTVSLMWHHPPNDHFPLNSNRGKLRS